MLQKYRFMGWVGLAVLVALGASPAAGQVQVTGVFVDAGSNTIMILGQNFTSGRGPLVVTLGQTNITTQCQTPPPTATQIICTFSTLPPAGDYLLTVARGNGPNRAVEYDLTIGAVGATGPAGPQGPAGPAGPQGIYTTRACIAFDCPCLQGEILISGGAICTANQLLNASYHPTAGNFWRAICKNGIDDPEDVTPLQITILCYAP